MISGLYSAATALNASELNHEVISNNLANVNVPGFRRSFLSFQEFENALNEAEQNETPVGYGTLVERQSVDFTPGVMAHTGRPLDVAINGDGFFVVDGPDGELFTRNGSFHLNGTGQLVTGEGYPLQGGPTIPVDAAPSSIQIGMDGTVKAGGAVVGQIPIVSFEDNSRLTQVGQALFTAPEDLKSLPSEATMEQGVRENSNVLAVDEMVNLVQTMRSYEAAQRVLRTIDEALSNNTDPQTG